MRSELDLHPSRIRHGSAGAYVEIMPVVIERLVVTHETVQWNSAAWCWWRRCHCKKKKRKNNNEQLIRLNWQVRLRHVQTWNASTDQSINQSINQTINRSINLPADQPINQSIERMITSLALTNKKNVPCKSYQLSYSIFPRINLLSLIFTWKKLC